jgi:hypothetical protein
MSEANVRQCLIGSSICVEKILCIERMPQNVFYVRWVPQRDFMGVPQLRDFYIRRFETQTKDIMHNNAICSTYLSSTLKTLFDIL